MTKITYIPGEIANAAIDEHGNRKPVTRAQHIFDDNLEKPQSEVNQDRIEDVATLDGKIALEKQRAEGVESGLNNRLGTVEQLAEISIGGGDAQIATGADFTNPDATKRAKVPTVGAIVDGLNDGVYDVSKRNPSGGPNSDGKFTLEYILSNANTLIPTSWRHGGMSISFVSTYDNKYVQYRLMTTIFNTTPSDWQSFADSKELSELSSKVEKIKDATVDESRQQETRNIPKIWNVGYYNENGVYYNNSGYYYAELDVIAGDVISIFRNDGGVVSSSRFVTTYYNNAVTDAGGSNVSLPYTVPNGVDKIICSISNSYIVGFGDAYFSLTREVIKYENNLKDDVDNLKNSTFGLSKLSFATSHNLIDTDKSESDKFLDTLGNLGNNGDYDTTDYVKIDSSKVYAFSYSASQNKARRICYYDASKQFIQNGYVDNPVNPIKPIENSHYVRISYAHNTVSSNYGFPQFEEGYFATKYTPYQLQIPDSVMESSIIAANSSRWKGNLNSESLVRLMQQNVKNNVLVAFSGKITSFNKITIGVIHDTIKSPYIEIDSTNVTIYQNAQSSQEIPHGLSISNNIQIILDVDFHIDSTYGALCLRRIIVCSNGEFATEIKNKNWTGDNNTYFIESNGSVLTDCSFSWTCKALESKVWLFGDSWFSIYSQRWVYQAVNKDFLSRVLVNGYAGQTSSDAIVSFRNLLSIGKPEYIVWSLGMNDPDSGAINQSWKDCVDEVIYTCNMLGIKLILYKYPNVPVWDGNPARDNNYKNQYIMSLGYRYIDAYAAMGDDGNGNWFEDFEQSSTDHFHTSVKGAKSLMMQVLADFPELELL